MKDVFISYKSEEFDTADWVKQNLEKSGISCWMAPNSIPGGSSYATEIPRAIRECKVFVLILSKKTQRSKWVPRELDQAINENKIIMPFMLEEFTLEDDFSFYLSNVQRYPAYENRAQVIKRMIAEIKAILKIDSAYGKDDSENESASVIVGNTACDSDKDETIKESVAEKNKTETKSKKADKPLKKPEKHIDKSSEKKQKTSKKSKKKLIVLPIIIIAAIIISGFVISLVRNNANIVKIAGVEYSKTDYSVEIRDTKLTNGDLKTLSDMENLYTLKIFNCDLTDLDFTLLKGKVLDRLFIEDSNLTDEQASLIDFSNFYSVSLGNNKIKDISSLNFPEDMYSLKLDGNSITSVTPLGNIKEIKKLSLGGCGLSTLSGLETCIKLEEINVADNSLKDMKGLENATLLKNVIISGNEISDISILSKSSETLKRLIADDNSISDLKAVSNCKILSDLSINNNKIVTIKPLADIASIVNFSAAGNKLSSLAGIEKCVGITYLNVADNNIEDISAISSVKQAENSYTKIVMILSGNKIVNLEIPKVKYSFLAINNNRIKDYSSLYEIDCRKVVFDYDSSIDYSVLKEKSDEFNIIGCPLDKQVSVSEALGSYKTNFVTENEAFDVINENLLRQFSDFVLF